MIIANARTTWSCKLASVLLLLALMLLPCTVAAEDVRSLWTTLPFPMKHDDVLAMARRLELSHDQLIAAESWHQAYVQKALELRSRAIDDLFKLDPLVLRIPDELPDVGDLKRSIALRRSFMSDLAGLDSDLFNQISTSLTEAQKSLLPPLMQLRERNRCLSDGFVAQWFERGFLPTELRDIVDELKLDPEARIAVQPLVDQFESQLTHAINDLFSAACQIRLDWRTAAANESQPSVVMMMSALSPASKSAQAVITVELEYIKKIRAALPEAQGKDFVSRVLNDSKSGLQGWRDSTQRYVTLALAQPNLTDAQRSEIQSIQAECERKSSAALLTLWEAQKRFGLVQGIRMGPNNLIDQTMQAEMQRASQEQNAQMNAVFTIATESLEQLRLKFGQEFADTLKKQWKDKQALKRTAQDAEARQADASNFGALGNVYHAWEILPTGLDWNMLKKTAMTLQWPNQNIEALEQVYREFDHKWKQIVEPQERSLNESLDKYYVLEARDAILASFSSLNTSFLQLKNALDAFINGLPGVANQAGSFAWIMQLQVEFADIADAPRNFPLALNLTRTLPRKSLTSQIERVNLAETLLNVESPLDRKLPGLEHLRDQAEKLRECVHELRMAVATACLDKANFELVMRVPQVQRDRNAWIATSAAHEASSTEAFRLRRELMSKLNGVATAAEALLDDHTASLWHQAVGRKAFPLAYLGCDAAENTFRSVAGLSDLSDSQKTRIEAGADEYRHASAELAKQIETLIQEYSLADDLTPASDERCAKLWAHIEQMLFERDEINAGPICSLRRILNSEQMRTIEVVR